jgi:hypothetical protein
MPRSKESNSVKKILVCFAVLLCAITGRAQVANNTSLVGTVTDPSGGVVAGAKVTAINEGTKVTYPGTTNAEGYYAIPFLLPGTYDVSVEVPGFQKTVTKGIIVTVNVAVRSDASLKVGSENTEVTISADNPPLSTDDALLGETVNQQQVQDLPTVGRQALQLAATASNIVINGTALTGNPPGNRASGAGTRSITNSISLDGISIMNNLTSTAFIVPNTDALDAVQTQNGNYTAQYGDYLGVHINEVTKSGTNKFHGTGYDYIQNDGFNARSWLQAKTVPNSQLRYNLFGGVVSGPIWKDKAFFLGSYEGLRQHGATSTTGTVLTARMRTGDFGELCTGGFVGGLCQGTISTTNKQLINPVTHVAYANNIIPVDPISAKVLPYLATPTQTGYSLANPINWQGNLPTAINTNANLERVDYKLNDKINLFARYAQQSVSNFSQAINLANTAYTTSRGRNGAFGYTHIITPKLVNDLHLGFNVVYTQIVNQQYQTGATNAGSALGIPGFTADVDSGNPGLVDMTITNYQGIGQSGTNWFQEDRTLTLYDQVSYTWNKHALMAGVSFRKFTIGRSAANTARGQFTFDQTLLSDGAAAFISGYATSLSSPLFQVKGSIGQWRDGFFVQDNWQVSQKFTLQYGLRYELPQVAYSLNGVGRILDPTWTSLYPAAGGSNPANAQKYPGFKFSGPQHSNISPRIGFSYRVTDKTVIRGGGGIYYNANQMNSYTLSSTNYPYSANVTNSNCLPGSGTGANQCAPALKFTLDNPAIPATTAFGLASSPYSAFTVDYNLPTQRMYQWNVDLGQEVWKNGGFELQYIGSKSLHLDESYYPNQPGPSAAFSNANRPNPNIGNIRVIHNDAIATYNGLTAILRQRMWHNLTANLSYTWSHALDESDSSNDGGSAMWQGHLKLDYGNSGYDIKNRFVGTVTYAFPKLEHSNMLLRQTLGGWQANAIVDLRSGSPMNLTLSTDYAHVNSVGAAQRPNFVHTPLASTCSRGTVTGAGGSNHNSCLDLTAYAAPANGTFGNLHRNAIYGPGATNTNASLFKNFPIWEQVSMQFRLEAFDVFNHPNPGTPNTNIQSASFGYITTSNTNFTSTGSRILQLAGKINF